MKKTYLNIALFSATLFAHASIHRVRPNDTFSHIALKYFGPPVYTKEGAILKLQSLNPQVKNLNKIYPGQLLQVSADPTEAPTPETETVQETLPEAVVLPAEVRDSRKAQVFYDYWKIENTSKLSSDQGNLYTRYILGAGLIYEKNLHPLRVFGEGSIFGGEFDPPSGRNLSKKSFLYAELKLRARYLWETWELGPTIFVTQRPFIKKIDQASLTVDSIFIPGGGLELAKNFDKFKVGAGLGYLSHSEIAHSGTYFDLTGQFQLTESYTLFTTFRNEDQSSSSIKRKFTSLRMGLTKEF